MNQCFHDVLKDQDSLPNFSNILSKYSRTLLYYQYQNTPKPCFMTTLVFR